MTNERTGKARGATLPVSSPSNPLPVGNIHRAFGALLIYRELFENHVASLAGIYPGEDADDLVVHSHKESYTATAPSSSSPTRLVRGGVRYSEDGNATDMSNHPRPAPQGAASTTGIHTPHKAPHHKTQIKPLDLPSEALAHPPPFTTTFSAMFYLATRSPTSASSLGNSGSLLSVGTESIARMLGGGPVSPGGVWGSPVPGIMSTSTGSDGLSGSPGGARGLGPNTGMSPNVGAGVVGYAGPGWSAPLSPLSRYEQEEQIRREALGLLPICAAYDTERFESGGWFTATMGALLSAWGIIKRENGEESAGSDSAVPAEKGERSYLVRVLGELAYAMRSSNVSVSYVLLDMELMIAGHARLYVGNWYHSSWQFGESYTSPRTVAIQQLLLSFIYSGTCLASSSGYCTCRPHSCQAWL